MKINIAIVAGGDSAEHDVSLKSAEGLISFLNKEKYNLFLVTIQHNKWQVHSSPNQWTEIDKNDFSFVHNGTKIKFDFAYIIIHGSPGENGLLQGYLNMVGIPHSTCNVLTAAITFNKYVCNQYLKTFGINVAKSVVVRQKEPIDTNKIIQTVGLPCFIKCTESGSSFGCYKTTQPSDIITNINKAFQHGHEVVCESLIEGKEVTCGMYKTRTNTTVFPITEVVSHNDFFDYNAKYNNEVEEITPARISSDLAERIRFTTQKIYTILQCNGIIRVDYIVDRTENIFLLEVNTTPGMTATSFIPQQIRAAKLNIGDVLDEIIENAMQN